VAELAAQRRHGRDRKGPPRRFELHVLQGRGVGGEVDEHPVATILNPSGPVVSKRCAFSGLAFRRPLERRGLFPDHLAGAAQARGNRAARDVEIGCDVLEAHLLEDSEDQDRAQ